jgi:hypothetical protein
MKLTTICILTGNPAREIVEGRAPKKFLNYVPARPFVCPPAPAPEIFPPVFEPPTAETIRKFSTKEAL